MNTVSDDFNFIYCHLLDKILSKHTTPVVMFGSSVSDNLYYSHKYNTTDDKSTITSDIYPKEIKIYSSDINVIETSITRFSKFVNNFNKNNKDDNIYPLNYSYHKKNEKKKRLNNIYVFYKNYKIVFNQFEFNLKFIVSRHPLNVDLFKFICKDYMFIHNGYIMLKNETDSFNVYDFRNIFGVRTFIDELHNTNNDLRLSILSRIIELMNERKTYIISDNINTTTLSLNNIENRIQYIHMLVKYLTETSWNIINSPINMALITNNSTECIICRDIFQTDNRSITFKNNDRQHFHIKCFKDYIKSFLQNRINIQCPYRNVYDFYSNKYHLSEICKQLF